jgi:transglutaminase-like putative cysteine protease
MNNYLKPTYYLDCDHPAIQQTVSQITEGCKDQIEALQKLFLLVRDQIPYNMYAVNGRGVKSVKNPLWEQQAFFLEIFSWEVLPVFQDAL